MVGGSGTGTWRRMDNNCGEVSHPELLLLATPLLPVLLHVDNCSFGLLGKGAIQDLFFST